MKVYSFRIKPGKDLKTEIENFVRTHSIKAGFIITCVGGLKCATLRSADTDIDKQDLLSFTGSNKNNFEITSLVGTVSVNGVHLHMSIADNTGKSLGGHLKEGSIVYPTAEVVIGEDEQAVYGRELDKETGYAELVIGSRGI